MAEEYLVHDDTEYEILNPVKFNKLTPEQQIEVLHSLYPNPETLKSEALKRGLTLPD
ncbi:MAG: hypothetical protein GXY08_14925 [Ruminococcus sp.]|nr:hypothetical protein [Ruminococcus sp.]